jgi:hypothetical protein
MPDKPKGQPLEHTDADLDTLSEVKPTDIKSAAAYWRMLAPPWAKNLLDAKREEPDA